ncbi:MAG: hypothetical protein L0212_12680 [Acidobacteria bacterium]|nr:hypothetical protein [Acidobacteriota bacterium]
MNRKTVFTLAVTLLLSTLAFAQGSGSAPSGGAPPSRIPPSEAAFSVTSSVKGTIASLELEERRLVVEDKKGQRVALKLNDNTRYKADKKTELADRKDLTARDFKPGQLVRVLYDTKDEAALEVRLAKK